MESTSHTVFIRLVTDVSNQGRGFELKFNASKKYILFKLEEKKILVKQWIQNNFCAFLDCKRQIRDLQGAIGTFFSKLNSKKN